MDKIDKLIDRVLEGYDLRYLLEYTSPKEMFTYIIRQSGIDIRQLRNKYTGEYFHGTSSIYLNEINKDGLNKTINYITKDPIIAFQESSYTVFGDPYFTKGRPNGVGGIMVVLVINNTDIDKSKLVIDSDYDDDLNAYKYKEKILNNSIIDILKFPGISRDKLSAMQYIL